jgi:hypothetical protein
MTALSAPGERQAGRSRRTSVGSSFTRSFIGAFARGIGLIAVALAIGVVLLQWSDSSTDAAAGGAPPPVGTPVVIPESTTTTVTTAPPGPRAASEVTVLVLNASGKSGQAAAMSERLSVVGYRTLTPGNATPRPDSLALCRPGLDDDEGTALVAATGLPATIGVLDAAAAAGMEGAAEADCVVVIGSR